MIFTPTTKKMWEKDWPCKRCTWGMARTSYTRARSTSHHTTENNKIIIQFSHTGNGLTTTDGEPPSAFAIAGADKKFAWAKTKIENNKVIVWSEEVSEPTICSLRLGR